MKRAITFALLALSLPVAAAAVMPAVPGDGNDLLLVANPDLEGAEWGDVTDDGDLGLNLESPSFDAASRTLSLVAPMVNRTDFFTPELSYTVSLYRGAPTALGTVEGLELATFSTGVLPGIRPDSAAEPVISVKVPETLDTGTYAVRVAVNDSEMAFYGLDVFPEGVPLTGNGGNLGYPDPFVFFADGTASGLADGLALGRDEGLSIGLDLGASKALRASVDAGDAFSAEAIVYDFRGREEHRFPARPMSAVSIAGVSALAANFEAWNADPGPYLIRVSVYRNGSPAALDPIEARWLVDGFVSRIHRLASSANIYQKGDSVDVSGEVSAFGQTGGERATLTVTLVGTDGKEESFSKALSYVEGEEVIPFDFSGSRASRSAKISRVDASLVNGAGEEIDRFSISVDAKQEFTARAAESRGRDPLWASVFGLAGIALIGAVYAWHRGRRLWAGAFLVVALAAVAWLSLSGAADAKRTTTSKPSTASVSVASSETGSLGVCPRTVNVTFKGHAYCPHCMNGTQWVGYVEYRYPDGTTGRTENKIQGFPGGMANNFAAGPFSARIPIGDPGKESVEYRVIGYVRRIPGVYHGFCNGSSAVKTPFSEASCGCGEGGCVDPSGRTGG